MKSFLTLVIFLSFNIALAGVYPPNYPSSSAVLSNGPFTVYRQNIGNSITQLHIRYTGKLIQNQTVVLFIKANYSSGSRTMYVPMEKAYSYGQVIAYTVNISNGCLIYSSGNSGRCLLESSNEMKHLLYWAQGMHGANDLNLELAATNEYKSTWDSNYSNNFPFFFKAK